MSAEARAAQFAPFAALSGHDEAIAETARLTDSRPELSSGELEALSQRLAYALSLAERPMLTVSFFVPDTYKAGGRIDTITARLRDVLQAEGVLRLEGHDSLNLSDITAINGAIFADFEL